jgi:hypothetical protein
MARWIACAVAVEPVKATPSIRGSEVSAAPTDRAVPRQKLQRRARDARLVQQRRARAAISGVASAGLASTALPAASAAAIWPVKMASGKFHGLMQVKTPRGGRSAPSRGRRSSAGNRPPRAVRPRHRRVLPASRASRAKSSGAWAS